MEILTKCHTIVVPMASCRVATRKTLKPIGSVSHGVFFMKMWRVIWISSSQDNTYYHDSSFEFMIKVKAWKWEWVVRVSQDSSTNKFGRVKGSESQPLPNEKHFGSYSPLVVFIFWHKSAYIKHGPNWAPIYHWEALQTLIL